MMPPIWKPLRDAITQRGWVVYQWIDGGKMVVGARRKDERYEVEVEIGGSKDKAILEGLSQIAGQLCEVA
jgi:hypothetical protein